MRRLISDNSLRLKRYFQTLILRLTYLNLLQVDNRRVILAVILVVNQKCFWFVCWTTVLQINVKFLLEKLLKKAEKLSSFERFQSLWKWKIGLKWTNPFMVVVPIIWGPYLLCG